MTFNERIPASSTLLYHRAIARYAASFMVFFENIIRREWHKRLSGNIWLVSFKISYLCLPLFYETRTTPSCHPSGCAYRQL